MSHNDVFQSSLYGMMRGVFVHTLIYPLEVVKIRRQCSEDKVFRIAHDLWQKEGVGSFYRGLTVQLGKTTIRQAWCWPMMTTIPPRMRRYGANDALSYAMTGILIATVDALVTTPLERAKIVSAFTGNRKASFSEIYKDGWRGGMAHWRKISVNWSTFLVAQQHLRKQYANTSGEPLTMWQLMQIGVQVAGIVSLVSAPFDLANTWKQAQNKDLTLFSPRSIAVLYRGWPLSALSLAIHNIASVTVLDWLSRRS